MQPNNRPNGDQTPDQTGNQAADQTALTIADAADRLGMTSEAVRMRLKRGTLSGAKVEGHWVVYLPATEQPSEQSAASGHDRLDNAAARDRTATEQPSERDQTGVVAVYQSLVASQREEIAFLREQLDKRSQELAAERERSDVLHREAFARIGALTAGVVESEPSEDDEPDDAPADGSRKSVIEQESPQTRDVAPGRTDSPDAGPMSNEAPPSARRGGLGGAWDWLTGR